MSPMVVSEFEPAPPPTKKGDPPWNIALLFPTQGEWTEDEYLVLNENTNRLVELSDGCLEVLPLPDEPHQWITRFLFRLFDRFVDDRRLGDVYFAPLPVRLWKGKMREPDILFLRHDRPRFRGKVPEGAELAVEIGSEGKESRKRDLKKKRSEYAKAGITEYWMVDPEQQQITVLTLDGKVYREHGIFGSKDTATSVLLDGFSVPVKDVFAVPERPTAP